MPCLVIILGVSPSLKHLYEQAKLCKQSEDGVGRDMHLPLAIVFPHVVRQEDDVHSCKSTGYQSATNLTVLGETYVEVAAKTSIFRALVMRAKKRAKTAEATTIRPSRNASLRAKYCSITEHSGSSEAMTVVSALRIDARSGSL